MAEASAERGRVTRERLLEAALTLIPEVGWHAVTTRMVAERAGVNPGLVHYHFSSVSDLLVAAVAAFAERMIGELSLGLADRPDVPDGVEWLLGELSRYSGTDAASMVVFEAFLAATRLPGLRTRLRAVLADFRAGTAAWLRLHGHPDPETAAAVFAAALDGIMLHRAVDPELDTTALAAPLIRMLTPAAVPDHREAAR